MEIDARHFGRGATLRLLVGYFNNPRLKRFLSCSRRGAPPGRQPPFGEREVAKKDGIMPIVPAQRLSRPLQPRLRFFPDVTPARPWPSLTGRFPPRLSRWDQRGYSVPQTYRFERLRQPLSPDGRTGVSSRICSVSTGRIPFGPSVARRSEFQHLPLVFTDEVYQDFTCVCPIVPA